MKKFLITSLILLVSFIIVIGIFYWKNNKELVIIQGEFNELITIQDDFNTFKDCTSVVDGILLSYFENRCEEQNKYINKNVMAIGYITRKAISEKECPSQNPQCWTGPIMQMQSIEITDLENYNEMISVATNKLEYKRGEDIKITIENHNKETILIYHPFYNIEKKIRDDIWEVVLTDSCLCVGVFCDIAGPFSLSQGETIERTWWQNEVRCPDYKQVSGGVYRVVIYYELESTEEEFYSYSNKFLLN